MKKSLKRLSTVLLMLLFVAALSMSVFAASGTWKHNSRGWWYQYTEGGYAKNCWEKIGGKWYYFNGSGYMQTGWIKSGGKWYYLNSSGAMTTGWQKVSGKWYYMNGSGIMQTGWLKSGGYWYYLNSSGDMATGWKKVGTKWYYFEKSGIMVTGKRTINGKTYTFSSSGAWLQEDAYAEIRRAVTGHWILAAGEDYYFSENEIRFERSVYGTDYSTKTTTYYSYTITKKTSTDYLITATSKTDGSKDLWHYNPNNPNQLMQEVSGELLPYIKVSY